MRGGFARYPATDKDAECLAWQLQMECWESMVVVSWIVVHCSERNAYKRFILVN